MAIESPNQVLVFKSEHVVAEATVGKYADQKNAVRCLDALFYRRDGIRPIPALPIAVLLPKGVPPDLRPDPSKGRVCPLVDQHMELQPRKPERLSSDHPRIG